MPSGERARADHGGPHDDDVVVVGEGEDCPDGATCLPPGSVDHHPREELQEEADRIVEEFFGSVSPSPPLDLDGDGVLDCWRGLTSNWHAPMTAPFNQPRDNGPHKGIDIGTPTGTGVRAAESGTVMETYDGMGEGEKVWTGPRTRGNFIKVDYGGGRIARYLHLKEVDVTPTQSVTVGELIGTVNDTGASRGAHLHYDLEVNGALANPADEYNC